MVKFEYENQGLKSHLEKIPARGPSGGQSDAELVVSACRAMLERQQPTLAESLTVISFLYADRVIVLDSAWRSAKGADLFEEKTRASELMLKFVTDYWQILSSGQGNAQAKKVFGQAFAATESETVENNERARSLRTFEYNGKPVTMMSHLKIGVKPSVAKAWRLHFHWDAVTKRLVIGHCGKHLDHE